MSGSAVNPIAVAGFSAGADAYARVRPGYPPAVAEFIVSRARDGVIVDLAAGTGKLTVDLVARHDRVIVVEPVVNMARHLKVDLPSIPMTRGIAESLPLRSGSVAVVSVAQAFHWFDIEPSLAELHRVLRPGGHLVVVFNERDESVDWAHQWTEIVVQGGGGRPYPPRADVPWSQELAQSGLFLVDAEMTLDNPVVTNVAGLVERAASTSVVAALGDDARAAVLARVADLASSHPDLQGRDSIVFPHRTDVVSLLHR